MDGHSSGRNLWKTPVFVGGPTEQTVSAKADCCEKLQCSGSCKTGVS